METLLSDLRYTVRSLRNAPTFTLVTIVTLALGIGTSTAGFTLANWLVLRPMPGVQEGDRVAVVWFGERRPDGFLSQYPVMASQLPSLTAGVPALRDFAGYGSDAASLTARAGGRRVDLEFVMPTYFAVLGTNSHMGRLLTEDDDGAPAGSQVVVIGHDLWLDLFDGDPAVIGSSLRVNTLLFTVVGVAPRGFQGARRDRGAALWIPGRASLALRAARGERAPLEPTYSEFIGRLAEGATFKQLEGQLGVVSERVIGQSPVVFRGVGVWPAMRATAEDTVRLLLAVTALVLLIACANAANLLLFRGLARRPQTAMRKVLGAGTGRLVRERLGESLLLGLLAGGLGMLLGRWLVDAFQGLSLWSHSATVERVALDGRVAVFAGFVGVVSAVLAGVAPAVVAGRVAPTDAVRRSTSTHTGGNTLRRGFAGLQLALCLALLVGALLLAATLKNLGRVTLGFDPDGVSAVSITPRDQGYDASRLVPYYRELLRRVREVPGVEAVSLSFSYPFASGGRSAFMLMSVAPAGAEPGAPQVRVVFLPVSPDYFRTLKIPLLTGSVFSPDEFLAGDEGTRRVAVISQSAARRLFGDRNPVGQFLGTGSLQVVGVVGDARHRSLERADLAFGIEGEMIYVPFAGGMGLSALLVRSSRPHAETVAAVRAIARQIDSSIPLYGEIALKEEVRRSLSDRVLFARLLLMLSVLAVGLAAVGVYGLVAYGVATHTREIGIRIALGAQRQRVLASVLREGGVVGVAGVTVGLGAALAVARLLRSRLFGVGSFEPGTYALAAAVLLAVVLLASLLPARAATRVDPMVALRAE